MKKWIFISLYWYPKLWWVENHIKLLKNEFNKRWIDLYHICFDSEESWNIDNFNIRLKPIFKTKIMTINLFFSFQLFFFRNKELFYSSDFIHIHDPGMIFWVFPQLLFWKLKKKIFITFHWWWWINPIPLLEKIIFFLASFLTKDTWAIYVWEFINKYFKILNKNKICIYWWVNKILINKNKKINNLNISITNRKKLCFFWRLEKDLDFDYFINFINRINSPEDYEIIIVWDWKLKSLIKNINKKFKVTFTWKIENPYYFLNHSDIIFTSWYLWILESLYLDKKVISFYSNNIKKDYLTLNTPFVDNIITINTNDINTPDSVFSAIQFFKNKKIKIPDFWEICDTYIKLYNK